MSQADLRETSILYSSQLTKQKSLTAQALGPRQSHEREEEEGIPARLRNEGRGPIWVLGREGDVAPIGQMSATRSGRPAEKGRGAFLARAASMCSFAAHLCAGPVCLQLRHGPKHSQPPFTPLAFQPSQKQPLKPTSLPFSLSLPSPFCPLFHYIKRRNKGRRTETSAAE